MTLHRSRHLSQLIKKVHGNVFAFSLIQLEVTAMIKSDFSPQIFGLCSSCKTFPLAS